MPTMNLSYVQFPSGTEVPDTTPTTEPLTPKSTVFLSTSKYLYATGTPPPEFVFVFWVINGALHTNAIAKFAAPNDSSAFNAQAWYLPVGGNGGTGVATWAFSLNKSAVISGTTPIASVTPAGAWSGSPSTTVSTTTSASPVVITAESLIAPDGKFKSWLQLYGNGTISGSALTVPASGASADVAFFGIPVPDPCQTYRAQLAALSPGDFLTIAAYEAAVRALSAELLACEKANGEIAITTP